MIIPNNIFIKHLGNDVVLGPSLAVTHERTANGVPIEQAICRKRLRPGSGFLSVGITTDGPTRVLQISDAKSKVTFSSNPINKKVF